MEASRRESVTVPPRLGLWDATGLVVGIIIGVGIFESPSEIFKDIPQFWPALFTWFAGGLLALIGAFCFAELATAYPKSGGEYNYLSRAFGPSIGFLYAWTQLMLIRPASIAALAFICGKYAASLFDSQNSFVIGGLAVAAIAALTAINYIGVTLGKNIQNLLTVLKILGLAAILVIGIGWGSPANLEAAGDAKPGWFPQAMILVLWTYAGWHEAAYIAAEVKNNRRNLPLSLIFGTVLVMGLYLLVNFAFVHGLGIERSQSKLVAADLVNLAWPGGGGRAMSVLIIVSSLGAINGMIFTTARICCAFGADHPLFASLSRWSPTWHTPARALVVQAIVCVVMLIGVLFHVALLEPPAPGMPTVSPFEDLVDVSAAVFWLLFLLTGVSLFALRAIDRDLPRPFKVPGYPVIPLLFCGSCVFMIYGAVSYRPIHSLVGLGIMLAGFPLYHLPPWLRESSVKSPQPSDVDALPV